MDLGIQFTVEKTAYNADYVPSPLTRATTNYANLARDAATRRTNIDALIHMVNNDLNQILGGSQSLTTFEIRLNILSIMARLDAVKESERFPITEVLQAKVLDTSTGRLINGPTGLNYSSYIRDYDFKILLPQLIKKNVNIIEDDDFGSFHGYLSKLHFGKNGVVPESLTIALSIAKNLYYVATDFVHPVLGREYTCAAESITDRYFSHMGLKPRFFKPTNYPAPMAFYSDPEDNLIDKDTAFLAALISVMGNFQRIYRPEIYLSRSTFSDIPGVANSASLENKNFIEPKISYDRSERETLSDAQAKAIEDRFFRKYPSILEKFYQNAA